MSIELGQGGHIKRLENLFKISKFEQDGLLVMYDNEFVSKSFHEKVGLVTQRNLVIVLKIRSKLTAFFFGILEDSDLPPIIGTEIREQYPECFMDFNLMDDQYVYVTTLKC